MSIVSNELHKVDIESMNHVGLKFEVRLVVFLFGPKFQAWLRVVPN